MITAVFVNIRTFTFLIAISNNIKLKPRIYDFIWQYWLRLYQQDYNHWHCHIIIGEMPKPLEISCVVFEIFTHIVYFYINKIPNRRCEFVQWKKPKLFFIASNINYNCTWKHIIQVGNLAHGYEFGLLVRNNLQT